MAQHFEVIASSLLPIWDTSIPDIPPRSRLYNHTPLGLNSPLVESLTSYICRLAYEHHVEVGTLIQYSIAPILGKQYIASGQSRSISSFLRYASPINGNGIMASDWVGALESLTLRADLALPTLLVGAKALSQRDLLQPFRQWCPMCYEVWRRQGAIIYEPLLWSINGITVCPEHCQHLERCCPHCSSSLPWLTWCSRPGYCSSCGRWLGRAVGKSQVEEKDVYIAETVGGFLARIPQLSPAIPREYVIQSLRDLIAATTEGNIAAFSRSLRLPKTTLWELVQGHFPPSLPFLLQLCYHFRLSLLQFLSGIEQDITPGASPSSQEQTRKHDLYRPFDREKVQRALEDILADQQSVPLSMREVARRLGYPVRTIKEYFPMHCREIACRYAEYRKQQGQLRTTHLRQRIYEAARSVHDQKLIPTYRYEHDDEVLEYYDQPSKIEMRYIAKSDRPVATWHTPDFFLLRVDGAGWEEWKPQEKLIELAESKPNRYQRDEQGHWHCPPGEEYAARYGLTYKVRSSSELNPIYVRNLNFLEDYLRDPDLQVDKAALKLMRELFAEEPVMTLTALLEHVEAQHIYSALLLKHFYVDLNAAPFADSAYVHIFRDKHAARAYIILSESPYRPPGLPMEGIEIGIGQGVVWDGRTWNIYNHGDTSVSLRSERGDWVEIAREEFYALASQGKITQPIQKGHANIGGVNDKELAILAKANTQDYLEGNERHWLLQRYWAGETPEKLGVPYRTLRDWETKSEDAKREYGHGYIGLLTKYQRAGNPQRKLPDESIEAMMDFIENDYETDRQKPIVHSHGQMVKYCKAKGIHPPSYKTYCKEIKKRHGYEQTLKRKGRRAAYQEKVPYPYLDQGTPRHGDFPWQIVHLDHFQADVQLVSSRTGKLLGKPWASVMTDANSRRILAVYLTFDPPSRRSDMMVIRECVRRYKRLPQILVVDGGSDFNSVYFEALLAYHNITKLERPAAEPRAGSVEERLFGTTKTGFIDNILGNTKALKNPREMTRSVDPRRKATWTLAAFYRRLCQWCYDVYDNNYHTALERTPREEYEAGITLSGVRPYRDVEYDQKFLAQTLPTSDGGVKLLVHYRKGVQVHYEFYRSKKLDEVVGTEVEVRIDPFDISRVFAFVKGEWTLCEAAHFLALRHHSERELQLISDELRRRRSLSAQQYPITIQRIAEFLASVEAEEQFGIQQLCDAESRDILQAIDVSYAAQFPLFQAPSSPSSPDEDDDDNDENVVDNEEIYGDYE